MPPGKIASLSATSTAPISDAGTNLFTPFPYPPTDCFHATPPTLFPYSPTHAVSVPQAVCPTRCPVQHSRQYCPTHGAVGPYVPSTNFAVLQAYAPTSGGSLRHLRAALSYATSRHWFCSYTVSDSYGPTRTRYAWYCSYQIHTVLFVPKIYGSIRTRQRRSYQIATWSYAYQIATSYAICGTEEGYAATLCSYQVAERLLGTCFQTEDCPG